jgi:uncharacterized Zn-binding protein involved in type VI secretion
MNNGALRVDDTLQGSAGEHSGHDPGHSVTVTGKVSTGSNSVLINGKSAARLGDTTIENDGCCGTSNGSVGSGSGKIFINGKPAARQNDKLNQHSGSGIFTSSSGNVIIGD